MYKSLDVDFRFFYPYFTSRFLLDYGYGMDYENWMKYLMYGSLKVEFYM